MHVESWTPPRNKVRATAFREIVSGRGSLLTWRHKDTLWVARAGLDARAWLLKLDESGRGVGGWIHGRPWLDELLRPPGAILCTRGSVLSRLRRDLKTIHRRSLHPLPEDRQEKKKISPVERMDPVTVALVTRQWPELVDLLAHWERRSVIRPFHARFAYARIRKAEHQLRRIEAVAEWLGHFPPGALAFVERHGFKERRWHLLNLWMRVPEGRELFDEIPALAWMLASSWLFREPVTKPFRSLRSLVRKPRARILEWLGLPPGDGTLKLLRMLPGAACELLPMIQYHAAFRNPTSRSWLLNLGTPLTPEILDAAVPGLISYPLLRAIAERRLMPTFGARDRVARVYFDVRSLQWGLENEIDTERLGRIRSTARLWEYHEELVALQNSRVRDSTPAWEGRKPPPVPPAEWMLPIETEEALETEARDMRHCLSSHRYRDAAAEGRYYAYAVWHELGRATLGITREFGEEWCVDQLRGPANGAVDPAVQAAVAEWAKRHGIEAESPTEPPVIPGGEAHGRYDVFAGQRPAGQRPAGQGPAGHRRLVLPDGIEDDIPF